MGERGKADDGGDGLMFILKNARLMLWGLLLVVVAVGTVCAVCWGCGNVVVNAVGMSEGGKRERVLEKQRELKFL